MASITYDGQCFMLDGRRLWLVCATIHPARVPHQLWASRIRAARQAGFNAIVAPVVWSRHEPRRGAFDFKGDADIAAFVRLVGREGLRCVLRVGPYVGAGLDMGGLPWWVGSAARGEGKVAGVRAGHAPFMDAVARWFGALAEQVHDLQATEPTEGPIVLVQVEHEWHCAHDAGAQAYLAELGRFLRESGFTVPFINANALYQSVEGEIEGWSGADDLLMVFRQLRALHADKPPILIEHAPGESPYWGHAHDPKRAPDAAAQQRMLAQALAAGAQFNVSRFHEGTNFAFMGGRLPGGHDRHQCASAGLHADTLAEGAVRTDAYRMLKRVVTFASSFGRVFASADPEYRPVTLAIHDHAKSAHGAVVTHLRGDRGDAAFVFDDAPSKQSPIELLLSDGSTLPIWMGDQRVAWRLFNVHLHGRATLDYTNASPFAQVGRVFVCYAPANTPVVVSINGATFEAPSPTSKSPVTTDLEGIVVVVCNEQQIDATYVASDAVHVGAAGFDAQGEPIPHPDFRVRAVFRADGEQERVTLSNAAVAALAASPRTPSLMNWAAAHTDDFVTGASERFAAIEAPGAMREMGAPYGYAWLRMRINARADQRVNLGLFEMEDRAHVYLNGGAAGLLGDGPGASDTPLPLDLPKGAHTVALLLDNLGRSSAGSDLGEFKGLYGHAYDAAPVDIGAPTLETGAPVSPLGFRVPVMGLREGEVTDSRRITWTFTHRRKSPLFVRLGAYAAPGLLLLNDQPIALLESHVHTRVRIDAEQIKGGKNALQVALMTDPAAGGRSIDEALTLLAPAMRVFEGTTPISEKADLAFAKWEPPDAAAFEPVAKAAMESGAGKPVWWRCTFRVNTYEQPLFFDATGLTKGQLFLNGRNLCRYFVGTNDGKPVPPQSQYYLPEPWLVMDKPNELLIFDEHGAPPKKCKLAYQRRD